MKKVYIVSSGSYSDWNIQGIWDDKELAEKHAALMLDSNDVEEYEMNKHAGKIKRGLMLYSVYMDKDGNESMFDQLSIDGDEGIRFVYGGRLRAAVWAKNKEHAIKIANEKRLQLIAENKWVEL